MAAKSIFSGAAIAMREKDMSQEKAPKLQAHCFKCKAKRDLLDATAIYTKTARPGARGQCAECGSALFRMGRLPAHEDLPKPEAIAAAAKPKPKPKRKTKAKSKAKPKARKSSKSTRRTRRKNVGKLVIVESPAKARSIGGFLGEGYTVMSSKGHVRDLPSYPLAVDVKNDFEPTYRVLKDKRDVVSDLKDAAFSADDIYLATDPDREGEAIAWHLIKAADMPDASVKRVVFHEITEGAVAEAFANPRGINMDLVNAQQARRIIDRLVGYKVTELLRRKARRGLTAGRVQSIALRLVVEREKAIQAFTPVEYWTIDAQLGKRGSNGAVGDFKAGLVKIEGATIARSSKDLDKAKTIAFHQRADIEGHLEVLQRSQFIADAIKKGTRRKSPSPPFTTSTLQQAASNRLGYSTRNTMRIAQQLYEGINIDAGKSVGLITYMRTDSVNVSNQAIGDARDYVSKTLGADYVPGKPRRFRQKAKGAQEAHEAIRPTGAARSPEQMQRFLNRDQLRLYRLIWERFLASQMSNAVYDTIRLDIRAGLAADDMPYLFRASGSTLKFAGFLAIHGQASEDDEGKVFPELERDDQLALRRLLPDQHFTQPPPRYTEASLVRALEENGIGRPSTYAPTVTLIQSPERNYIERDGRQLVPTQTGCTVSDLLSQYFDVEMDYAFTAQMEDQLDDVSSGRRAWRPMLGEFYTPFEQRLLIARENMPKQDMAERVGRKCPSCESGDLIIRYGRWGKFIGCSAFPDCRHTEPLLEKTGRLCPQCGETERGELVARRTKKGRRFYGCIRFPDCDYSAWKLPRNLPKAQPAEMAVGEAAER